MDKLSIYPMGTAVAPDFASIVERTLAAVAAVERVYVSQRQSVLRFHTIIDEPDEAAYDAIYDRERFIMQAFPGRKFDFNVVARRGRRIEDLLGDLTPVWTRSAEATCRSAMSI